MYTIFKGNTIYKRIFCGGKVPYQTTHHQEKRILDKYGCYARKADFGVYRVYKVYKVVDLQGFAGMGECTKQRTKTGDECKNGGKQPERSKE